MSLLDRPTPFEMSTKIEKPEGISEPNIERAWSEEIKRRLAEIDDGTVTLIPWEEVRAELFECPRKTDVHNRLD